MTIVKSPLFTTLYDKLGNSEFRRRRNRKIELAKKRIPSNPRTFKQRVIRKIYGQCVERYNQLTEEEKRAYAEKYRKENLDAYRGFMKECLRQNKPTAIYEVVIDNSANTNELTDFQVLLNIENDTQFFEDIDYNPYAFYFMDEDLTKKISFYREYFNPTTETTRIWLKVPSIPAEGKVKLYMLINPNRTIDESNGDKVFLFFDDFIGDSLDTSKWIVRSGTNYNIQDSELHVLNTDTYISSKNAFTPPFIVEVKMRVIAVNKQLGLSLSSDGLGGGVRYYFLPTGAEDYYVDSNGDGKYELALDLFTDSAGDTYEPAGLKITTSEVTLFYNRNNVYSERTDPYGTSSPLYIGLGAYRANLSASTGNEIAYDWIRVRKYTEPEPTITYTKL